VVSLPLLGTIAVSGDAIGRRSCVDALGALLRGPQCGKSALGRADLHLTAPACAGNGRRFKTHHLWGRSFLRVAVRPPVLRNRRRRPAWPAHAAKRLGVSEAVPAARRCLKMQIGST